MDAPTDKPDGLSASLAMSGLPPEDLAQAIASGVGMISESQFLDLAHEQKQDCELVVGLRSAVAYEEPLAPAIAEGLRQRFNLAVETTRNITVALTEALSNSLIHGNLEIQPTGEHLDPALWTLIQERIDDPLYADRLIWLSIGLTETTLTITLTNQGPGHHEAPPQNNRGAHRGMSLMVAATLHMTYSDGMRCLKMTFSR